MRARWSRQGRAAPDGLPPSGRCSRHEIDNAVDATLAAPAPRRVTVTVRQDEAELLVRVADTRHDGSIQVANDSGAVFTIRLPLPTPVEHTT